MQAPGTPNPRGPDAQCWQCSVPIPTLDDYQYGEGLHQYCMRCCAHWHHAQRAEWNRFREWCLSIARGVWPAGPVPNVWRQQYSWD